MTKKKWILVGGVAVLCLLLLLGLLLRKPAADEEPTGTTGTGSMDYTIQVCSESDVKLEEVGVYVYTDKKMTELVWFAKTDAEGKITFSDVPSDNFVAVLADVPAGYLVEEYYPLNGAETQIRLPAGLMEGDLSTVSYKLGDLMLDFTVTASDGTEYKLSEILKEKKALILNYWYLQCAPCKSEFPYLQTAYEEYSEDVLLLALNPVNQDNEEIEAFRKENGYTFPMAAADPNWEKALSLTAYPTTVVIDRYGYISLIHSGSVTEEGLFEAIMEYYAAEDYEQTTFRNLDDLQEEAGFEQTVGTETNPIEIGASPSFQVVVPPGHEMHYDIYRLASTLYLSVRNEYAYIIHNGTKYEPTGGSISIPVVAEDTNSAVRVIFGNSGKETQTYTVTMAAEAGSMGNPYTLTKNDFDGFTANVPADRNQGIFYNFVPDMDGVFTIEIKSVTAGIKYGVSLTTVTPSGGSVQRTLEEGRTNADGNMEVAINAYKGTRIDINIATLPVEGAYPAATFKLAASLEEGSLDTNIKELKVYSVNVTDETGAPVSGVKMTMTVGEKTVALTTTNGVATTRQEVGTYPVVLTVPRGFTAKTTEFELTEKNPSVSIKLDTIEKATYTVTVTDSATGAPVQNADVFFMDSNGEMLFTDPIKTDATGKVELTTSKGSYSVSILKDGYISDAALLTPEAKDAQVALVEGTDENTVVYTINAQDYFGNAVSGMRITFQQNGVIKAMADVIGGKAERRLLPGTYTIEELIPEDSPYYCKSENPQAVTVTQGQVAEVTFTNALRSGEIIISKVDNTGDPRAGAEFLLEWSEDGSTWQPVFHSTIVTKGGCSTAGLTDGKLTSGDDGLVTFDGLYLSLQYRLTETKAPDGLQLLTEAAFQGELPIDTDYIKELTVVNVPNFTMPMTGSKSRLLMASGLIVCLAACAGGIAYLRRKRW